MRRASLWMERGSDQPAQRCACASAQIRRGRRGYGGAQVWPEDGLRPQLVNFNQCENILIEGVTLLRSPFWVIHPLLSKNITVRSVTIDNDGFNGDGCDPESCDGVLIENCIFNTGDDCIAVKSGRNNDGSVSGMPLRRTSSSATARCVMATAVW